RADVQFKVTMVPGDGVGPELMTAVKEVFKAADVPVVFEEFHLSEVQNMASEEKLEQVLNSMRSNRVAIKVLPGACGLACKLPESCVVLRRCSSWVAAWRKLDLFANVVRVNSLPGYKTRHNNLDLVIIREQTEGEYSSLEHESVTGVVECLKIITRVKSRRIAKFAFDYATKNGRSKVTAVHKANIMKLADGLFLQSCQEVGELYPKIKFETIIIDNCCMQGARHPFAQAVGRNIANPTAMLLSSANMLHHLNLEYHSNLISEAVKRVIKLGKVTTL
ncbi:UNVERIFIED_CONTAM: hypothetical protein FKN15_026272, partial [Acipenser sinensis]